MNSISLFIHNTGYIISSILVIGLAISVFIKDHKPLANKMIILAFLAVTVFTISHVVGVNISDPHLSRLVLSGNLAVLFISCFFAHSVFALIGKLEEQRVALIVAYVISGGLFIFFIIFPDTFLLDSVPKLYFTNYYVAGKLYWLAELVSNTLIPAYFLLQMFLVYRTADFIIKNRLKYLFTALLCGYVFGITAVPLVYGVPVDPVWSIFFVPVFAIPFAYAVLKYELMDIRVTAKQAFVYAILIASIGVFIGLINYASNIIIASIPGFPEWIFPLLSAVIAVTVSYFVWHRLREADFLKYEFISIVTHKFRTPLTYIKWSTSSLSKANLSPAQIQDLESIDLATHRLTELTNLLLHLSDVEDSGFKGQLRSTDVTKLIGDVVSEYASRAEVRQVMVKVEHQTVPPAFTDELKMKYIFQILIDNAIKYSVIGGKVSIIISHDTRGVITEVSDSGIGISEADIPHVFDKFFRSSMAMRVDTEGLGIDLFMAKQIIEKRGGEIWVESRGEGKGTSFFVKLPIAVSKPV